MTHKIFGLNKGVSVFSPFFSKSLVIGNLSIVLLISFSLGSLDMTMSCDVVVTCVCVFTSIHREGFICLDQLEMPGNRSMMLCRRLFFLMPSPFIAVLE